LDLVLVDLGNSAEDLLDFFLEALFQYLIRLVQANDLNGIEPNRSPFHQIIQPAWGGYQNINALIESPHVILNTGLAIDHIRLEIILIPVPERLDLIIDLHGQLPRGQDDQELGVLMFELFIPEPFNHG